MQRSRLLSILALGSALAFAAPAFAQPSAATSTLPCQIRLVGEFAGAPIPDPNGEFKIVVRDAASNPMPGLPVVLDFSGCMPDIQLDAPPGQNFPGMVVNCPVHQVMQITDATGTATFRIVGKAINPICGASPGAPFRCCQVIVPVSPAVSLGNLTVVTLDYNGDNQVTPPDLSCLLTDFFANNLQARGDFNCDGHISVLDASAWVGLYFGGSGGTVVPGPFCLPPP